MRPSKDQSESESESESGSRRKDTKADQPESKGKKIGWLKDTPAEKEAKQAAKAEKKAAAKAERKAERKAEKTRKQLEEEKKKAELDKMPAVLTAEDGAAFSVHVKLKTVSSELTKPKESFQSNKKHMIEVVLNDRLGKKVRVKCNNTDTVLVLKKLAAAQLGTRYEKLRIQKWYNIYKDHISLVDYEVHDGMGLELYYM